MRSYSRPLISLSTTLLWKEKCWGDIRLFLWIGRTRRWVLRLNQNLFCPSVAKLDIVASLIGKFHSNPSCSFWGHAITRKIKDGRRRPCFSTDRICFWYLHNKTLRRTVWPICKKNSTSGLGGDAIWSLSIGNFTKSELGPKWTNLSTDRISFCTCTTRHWGEHNRQVSFESVE